MLFPENAMTRFQTHMPAAFSLSGFWRVLGKLANRGGRKLIILAMTLFHCLNDPETPAWAKSVIIGALGYLIFPLDFIPDAILAAGFTDDWSVILGAVATVATHIKEEHKAKAAAVADRFLGGGKNTDSVPFSAPGV
jgi:uncharacterized membrane protein YkvA (DUF1232 family)